MVGILWNQFFNNNLYGKIVVCSPPDGLVNFVYYVDAKKNVGS